MGSSSYLGTIPNNAAIQNGSEIISPETFTVAKPVSGIPVDFCIDVSDYIKTKDLKIELPRSNKNCTSWYLKMGIAGTAYQVGKVASRYLYPIVRTFLSTCTFNPVLKFSLSLVTPRMLRYGVSLAYFAGVLAITQ